MANEENKDNPSPQDQPATPGEQQPAADTTKEPPKHTGRTPFKDLSPEQQQAELKAWADYTRRRDSRRFTPPLGRWNG